MERDRAGTNVSVARVTLEIAPRRECDYLIPKELRDQVEVGTRVRVPFGAHQAILRYGYVDYTGIRDEAGVEADKALTDRVSALMLKRLVTCRFVTRATAFLDRFTEGGGFDSV